MSRPDEVVAPVDALEVVLPVLVADLAVLDAPRLERLGATPGIPVEERLHPLSQMLCRLRI